MLIPLRGLYLLVILVVLLQVRSTFPPCASQHSSLRVSCLLLSCLVAVLLRCVPCFMLTALRTSICPCNLGTEGAPFKWQNQEWPFPGFSLFTVLNGFVCCCRHSVVSRAESTSTVLRLYAMCSSLPRVAHRKFIIKSRFCSLNSKISSHGPTMVGRARART